MSLVSKIFLLAIVLIAADMKAYAGFRIDPAQAHFAGPLSTSTIAASDPQSVIDPNAIEVLDGDNTSGTIELDWNSAKIVYDARLDTNIPRIFLSLNDGRKISGSTDNTPEQICHSYGYESLDGERCGDLLDIDASKGIEAIIPTKTITVPEGDRFVIPSSWSYNEGSIVYENIKFNINKEKNNTSNISENESHKNIFDFYYIILCIFSGYLIVSLFCEMDGEKKIKKPTNVWRSFILGLRKSNKYSGRSSRYEFWWFWFSAFILSFISGFMLSVSGGMFFWQAISWVLIGAMTPPSIAVAVRRLHDTGRTGWLCVLQYAWIPVALLFPILLGQSYDTLTPPQISAWISATVITAVICGGYFVYLMAKAGDQGGNEYGASPLADTYTDDEIIFAASETDFPERSKASAEGNSVEIKQPKNETAGDPYRQAGEELLSGNVDAACWARAMVDGNGEDGAVKVAYIKLRVAQL